MALCYLLAASAILRTAFCVEDVGPGPFVDTSSGRVVGLYTDQAQVFRSIPYARPPVGELRWKDPMPPFPVPGILDCTEDPPGCPQVCDLPVPDITCPNKTNEDCLYLNVFSPLNASSESNLPVMAFIHGGNFIQGYSGGKLYDAQYVVNTTATVIVTINYRLGALGFLAYGEGEDALTGNYGLRDQRLALKWVRDNIKGFGGNPLEVTLWGQSAGAASVAVHMSSIKSAGLFNKAIMESNPFGITLKDMNKARKLGEDFAKLLDCRNLQCLHSKNSTEIAIATVSALSKIVDFRHVLEVFFQWTPIVDYIDLFDQPMNLMMKGELAPLPMIVGTTYDDGLLFIYQAFTSPVSSLEYDAALEVIFQKDFEKLHKFYPPSKKDNRLLMSAMGTAYTFTCTTRRTLWSLTNKTRESQPVWLYVFNHSLSFDAWGKDYEFCVGHSCHAIELPFVFHTVDADRFTPSAAELDLASNMTRYWTNFARSGNPNDFFGTSAQRLPDWSPYYTYGSNGTKNAGCMRFRTPGSEAINDYFGDVCTFWDSIGYNV